MRLVALAAFVGFFALAGGAHAAALPFDPDDATRAWLATMGAEATEKSNRYFEGGYVIDFAGTLVSVLVGGLFFDAGLGQGRARLA